MKVITKDEAEQQLGKGSFWMPKQSPGSAIYLHGLDGFDEVKDDSATKSPFGMLLLPKGVCLSIMHNFKRRFAAIPFSQLHGVIIETPEDIVTKKDKSVIGRALLGGVLLGPVGALIGGMSGLKEGVSVTKQDAMLTLTIEEKGQTSYVVASIEQGAELNLWRDWLKKHLKHCYQE